MFQTFFCSQAQFFFSSRALNLKEEKKISGKKGATVAVFFFFLQHAGQQTCSRREKQATFAG